jgi:(p)ppGpp synthase/HD superfamily hydrolase
MYNRACLIFEGLLVKNLTKSQREIYKPLRNWISQIVPANSLEYADKALQYAIIAHDDQKRKYTKEPYMFHPVSVLDIAMPYIHSYIEIQAILLHDVVEDTEVTLEDIKRDFGEVVANLVEQLTDVSTENDGVRADRKRIDLEHTALASLEAKTIKLADIIDNSRSILKYDSKFAGVYMQEKRELLKVLKEGNKDLYNIAEEMVTEYFKGQTELLMKLIRSS